MTALRRCLVALAAALAATLGVAAATGETRAQPAASCEGWTAYAPWDEAARQETYSGDQVLGFLELVSCGERTSIPPDGWPPGAQPPVDSHPEIQIIR